MTSSTSDAEMSNLARQPTMESIFYGSMIPHWHEWRKIPIFTVHVQTFDSSNSYWIWACSPTISTENYSNRLLHTHVAEPWDPTAECGLISGS